MYSAVKNPKIQNMLLLTSAFAIFMDGFDSSIVNSALPVIAAGYETDISSSSWVVMAYMLLMAGFLLSFGKIADNGRIREVFSIGFAFFSIGSLFCALSPSLEIMIASRAFQGLGASMIAAAAPLIITRFLPIDKRGFGMGVIAATGGIAFALGPPAGGLIASYLSWHWMFLINIPIGITAIILAKSVIPKPYGEVIKEKFDIFGTILIFAATASMIISLERGPILGWSSVSVAAFGAVFVISTALFCIHSLKSKNPLLDIRIFKSWKFTFVTISYLLTCAVFAGVMYMIPYYIQGPLDLNAAVCGMLLMIAACITAVVGIPIGAWSDRIGCRIPCILAAVFRISFCLVLLFIVPEWGAAAVIPALVFMGLAFGISGGPATSRIVQFSPKGSEGSGTSVMITSDFLGGVIGVASYALVFSITVPASVGVSVSELSDELFLSGFHATSLFGLILGLITLFLSAAVPNLLVKRYE